MKKIFNLALFFSLLMTALSFSACSEDKADNIDEEFENQVGAEYVDVQEGRKYAVQNNSITGATFNFTVNSVSGVAGSKIVNFTMNLKGDPQDGKTFELGDDASHASYFGRDASGNFACMKQNTAVANASQVIMALSSEANTYRITSATVNNSVNKAGATQSKFLTYKKK